MFEKSKKSDIADVSILSSIFWIQSLPLKKAFMQPGYVK